MNDALSECYELLGLRLGASPEELKVAYRDLTKVWHPDRFLHDPRLQEKAQEKLKEINEAYDQLRSGKARRQRQSPPSTNQRRTPPTAQHFDQYARAQTQTGNAVVPGIRWHLILVPVMIFAAVFFATYRSLLRPGLHEDESQVPAVEQAQAPPKPERAQPGSRDSISANELPHVADRTNGNSERDASDSESTSQASAAPLRPMPSVTVLIDPYTGMLARPDCPLKSRMTYPSGSEPHEQCNAVHPSKKIAPADASVPKDSRIKSVAKRLASPGKWFGDGAKSDAANKQDPKSP